MMKMFACPCKHLQRNEYEEGLPSPRLRRQVGEATTDLFFGRIRFDFGLIRLFSAFLWGKRRV
jgi:hypothetical protein